MATFSVLAIVIACLGLFGLSSYTILQRTKEIGIRKVLGASVSQIVNLLSMEYIRIVAISSVVACPLAYWACTEWLSTYTTRIGLNAWIFLVPMGMILALALLTVSLQTIQSALANPVDSLKQE
jgi:putative ABC transport system permease protein